MSRNQSEAQYRSKSNVAPRQGEPFVVIRPTSEERQAIKEQDASLDECLNVLVGMVVAGHRLSWGYKADNGSFFVHLKEGAVDWDKAVTLSAFHTDWHRCLQIMAWAVTKKYPFFPDGVQFQLTGADDW
jgi:hypothetical protein